MSILEGLGVSCAEGPALPIAVGEREYESAEDMFDMLLSGVVIPARWP